MAVFVARAPGRTLDRNPVAAGRAVGAPAGRGRATADAAIDTSAFALQKVMERLDLLFLEHGAQLRVGVIALEEVFTVLLAKRFDRGVGTARRKDRFGRGWLLRLLCTCYAEESDKGGAAQIADILYMHHLGLACGDANYPKVPSSTPTRSARQHEIAVSETQ